MIDVTALGELLIDFTQNGISDQGNFLFEANPGGAPCNVLAMLQKLGRRTAFIGKVGNDNFGCLLKDTLVNLGINVDSIVVDEEIPTTLAFIHTQKDGERNFTFYRKPGADMMLKESDISEALIKDSKILHFGSLSMTNINARKATMKAINIARQNNVLLSFDPNLRPQLWNSLDDAKAQIRYGLSNCNILKISEEELEFVVGKKNIDWGVKYIRESYDIDFILVTMGKQGSKAFYQDNSIEVPAFIQKNTIDTTGAGDTFFACILNIVIEKGINSLTFNSIREMLLFANAAASLITTRRGALSVMPDKKEIASFLAERVSKT